MKTIERPMRCWLLTAAWAAAFGLLVGACSSDDEGTTTDTGASTPLTVDEIIAAPKSASPGDTLMLSAIVTSTSTNPGDVPSMEWSATGGAFIEDDQTTVRWIAPAGGVYTVTARATNTVSSATGAADLFVGGTATLVTSQAGEIRLRPAPDQFYYERTQTNIALGVDVWQSVVGAVSDAVDDPAAVIGTRPRGVAYAPDLSYYAYASDSIIVGFTTSPVHLYVGDFGPPDSYRRVSGGTPINDRYPGFTDPDISPDDRIAYGGMLPTPLATGADTFDVFVYDTNGPTRTNVTQTHANHRNAFPTWSTDMRWLTFVSDRGGARGQNELWGMPISAAGVINTANASAVRLSNTGGTLVSGTIGAADFLKPEMAWNPVVPTVALIGSDGALYIVITTPAGATQANVASAAVGFAWSPDGEFLALAGPTWVATVRRDGSQFEYKVGVDGQGNATRPGDTFDDLAWSPDGAWLVYRAERAGSVWFEAFDVDQSTVTAPIPVSPAEDNASTVWNLGAYRVIMSLAPAWSNDGKLYYTTFGTGFGTIGIRSVDVSGLTP